MKTKKEVGNEQQFVTKLKTRRIIKLTCCVEWKMSAAKLHHAPHAHARVENDQEFVRLCVFVFPADKRCAWKLGWLWKVVYALVGRK